MRKIAIGLAVWLLSSAPAAAFNCAAVKLPWDIVVCTDPELKVLADQRLEAFEQAKTRLNPSQIEQLRQDQSAWVRSYSASCGIRADRAPPTPMPAEVIRCFKRAGEERLTYLRAYGPPADVKMGARGGPAADKALHDAAGCRGGQVDIATVKAALKLGADPNARSEAPSLRTPLWCLSLTTMRGNPNAAVEAAKILFAAGAKLGPADRDILYFAVSSGSLEMVRLLVEKGASPTAKMEGFTPTDDPSSSPPSSIHDESQQTLVQRS